MANISENNYLLNGDHFALVIGNYPQQYQYTEYNSFLNHCNMITTYVAFKIRLQA